MDTGARITELREKRGLSTNKLAKLAGISQSHCRDVEIGKSQPTIDVLARICEALEITLAEFFAEEDGGQIDTRAARLADGATELPPEAEKELEQLMEYLRHKYGKKQ